jgi:hypothetical protein
MVFLFANLMPMPMIHRYSSSQFIHQSAPRFSRLYRGIVPPILVEAPKRAIKFSANEQYTKLYKSLYKTDKMTQGMSIMSGVSAGCTEAVVIVPAELVKIRLQDKANVWKGWIVRNIIRGKPVEL